MIMKIESRVRGPPGTQQNNSSRGKFCGSNHKYLQLPGSWSSKLGLGFGFEG